MTTNNFDINWENNIYAKGKHINKYPYGELVSVFFNSLKYLDLNKDKKNIKVLELGCGAGNNLWFISELGFDVYGIDGSEKACEIAGLLQQSRKTKVNIQQASFDDLPFENESIDILIDREATYCGTIDVIKKWWNEANRVLKPGGVIISFMFSDDNPYLVKIKSGECKAQKVEHNTYTNIETGTFKDTGIIHFTEYNELADIFHFCEIQFINKHSSKNYFNKGISNYNYSEWIVVGKKLELNK